MELNEEKTGFRRILVPVGGRAWSEDVLTRAERLLKRPDVTVTLLTVIEAAGPGKNTPEYRADPRHQALIDRLDNAKTTLASRGIMAETQVRFGRPAKEIDRETETTGHDLIVMATRGRTEFGRLFLGSVAQKVLHFTRVPVLLFRTSGRSAERPDPAKRPRPALFRRIFVPLEGTKLSEQSLPQAIALARVFGSEIRISTVIPAPFLARTRRKAARYIDSLLERLSDQGLKATGEVISGDPCTLILQATARDFDTVAMATHGRTALGSILWGSETVHVLREADVPVLVVRGRRNRRPAGSGKTVGAPAN